MCETIVITTSEQAEAMLEHLDACKESARSDDYATERRRPVKWLTCTCCGENYQGRQWWNQDCGYGLGDCCVEMNHADPTPGAESSCYGVAGIHFLIPQAEKDNPPIVEDRGQPLHGIDSRLRIECNGHVFWRGIEIEHWSGGLLQGCEKSRDKAKELVRRCEIIEGLGKVVCFYSVVWRWED